MVSLPNRLFRGIVKNPTEKYKHPNFQYIIVDTVREIQDIEGNWHTDSFESYDEYLLHNPDYGDIFYVVYGSYWIDIPLSSIKITETDSLNQAINIAEAIMGSSITEIALLKK
jgi:hypothetical protein